MKNTRRKIVAALRYTISADNSCMASPQSVGDIHALRHVAQAREQLARALEAFDRADTSEARC